MHFKKILSIVALLAASLTLTGGILTTAQTQEEVDLTKGLVAYWSFDEGEGDIVFDESVNYNDGGWFCNNESCSTPQWIKGKVEYTLKFNGTGYIKVAADPSLQFGQGNFSISFWLKTTFSSSQNKYMGLVASNRGGWESGYGFRFVDGWGMRGAVSFGISDGSHDSGRFFVNNINDGQWHHIVGMRRNSELFLYVDGEEYGLRGVTNIGGINSDWGLGIGALPNGEAPLQGIIDEVYIYDRALTINQVNKLYHRAS